PRAARGGPPDRRCGAVALRPLAPLRDRLREWSGRRPGTGKGRAREERDGRGTRPSRPRPGQAVAVAETAGGAGSARGASQGWGVRHRDGRNSTVLQESENALSTWTLPWHGQSRQRDFWSPVGDQNPGRVSVTATSPWTSRRKRHEPPRFPPEGSRPGRLVAATACPGRHETPGTAGLQPPGPGPSPSRPPGAWNQPLTGRRAGQRDPR